MCEKKRNPASSDHIHDARAPWWPTAEPLAVLLRERTPRQLGSTAVSLSPSLLGLGFGNSGHVWKGPLPRRSQPESSLGRGQACLCLLVPSARCLPASRPRGTCPAEPAPVAPWLSRLALLGSQGSCGTAAQGSRWPSSGPSPSSLPPQAAFPFLLHEPWDAARGTPRLPRWCGQQPGAGRKRGCSLLQGCRASRPRNYFDRCIITSADVTKFSFQIKPTGGRGWNEKPPASGWWYRRCL